MVCSGVVYSMFSLFLTETLNIEKSQIGLIYMTGSAVGFVFAPTLGKLADKFGRKVVIISSMASFVVVFLLYAFVQNYQVMFGIQALEGVSWVAIGASANAYVADIAPYEKRGWALGIYQRIVSLGWIAGPAIGGFLFEIVGFRIAFLFGGIVVCVSIVPALILLKESKVT
jgi:MFS family permease